MTNPAVRKASANDLDAVQSLAREVIQARYTGFLGQEAVAGFISIGQSDAEFVTHLDHLYLLEQGGRILGCTICFDDFIHLMMIRLDAQRGGYGSQLLHWCETQIRSRGYATARLETFLGNEQAVSFYRRNGWAEARRDTADAGTLARIWFEKPLN